jgi:hypothetical protein
MISQDYRQETQKEYEERLANLWTIPTGIDVENFNRF